MTDNPENLVLEHLRHMRARLDAVYDIVSEHGDRFLRLETAIISLRRDYVHDHAAGAEHVVGLQGQIDRLRRDMERVQRRLDLIPGEGGPGN